MISQVLDCQQQITPNAKSTAKETAWSKHGKVSQVGSSQKIEG